MMRSREVEDAVIELTHAAQAIERSERLTLGFATPAERLPRGRARTGANSAYQAAMTRLAEASARAVQAARPGPPVAMLQEETA